MRKNYLFLNFRYKLIVAEAVVEYLKPIQRNINELLKDEEFVLDKLKQGGEKAASIADKTLNEVYYKLGLEFKIEKQHKLKVSS